MPLQYFQLRMGLIPLDDLLSFELMAKRCAISIMTTGTSIRKSASVIIGRVIELLKDLPFFSLFSFLSMGTE